MNARHLIQVCIGAWIVFSCVVMYVLAAVRQYWGLVIITHVVGIVFSAWLGYDIWQLIK